MSINNQLINFVKRELVIRRNSSERNNINRSLKRLEKTIWDKLGGEICGVKRFGSYTRNTIIPRKYDPQSDVDLMIVMDASEREYMPNTYRDQIRRVVKRSYPRSISKKNFPCIKLELNHIMFDLVPAVIETSFRGNEKYYIPDTADSWMETDPNDFNSELSDANQYYGYNTVRNVIRLMKRWNATKKYPFDSYLLEREVAGLRFSGCNTYEGFKYALDQIAYEVSNTRQALEYIDMYDERDNHYKELQWVSKLLGV